MFYWSVSHVKYLTCYSNNMGYVLHIPLSHGICLTHYPQTLLSPLSDRKLTYVAKSLPSMVTQHQYGIPTLEYHLHPDRNCPNTIITLLSYY